MRDTQPRLGKGLVSLFGDSALGNAAAQPKYALTLDSLTPGPFQPRVAVDDLSLEDLALSIKQQGVLQPILVRPHPSQLGSFEIIAGERRWRASRLAGLAEIPVLIRPMNDSEAAAAALVENLQREDLNPLEEAEGYARLIGEFAMTHDQLGSIIGRSRSHIANTIRLLQLSEPVKDLVRRGSISAGHARALLSHPEQAKAAAKVVEQGLSVRQTEALQKHSVVDQKRVPIDPDLLVLQQSLSDFLGLRVLIKAVKSGGTLSVQFETHDQLEGLVRLLKPD